MPLSASKQVILALDQGTTNTKVVLIDQAGEPAYRASAPLALFTPQAGFVEQDALALWESVLTVATQACNFAHNAGVKIAGIAISNQRETAIAWHRGTGAPLAPAVSWQCRRSTQICDRLAAHADTLRELTGLPLDPVLSATKWAWLLEHVPAVQAAAADDQLCLGTVDAWLLYKLTGGAVYATDMTNASRTGLLDLQAQQWHRECLRLYRIPEGAMPEVRASSGVFGSCTAIAELAGVPIVAAIGDSHAALAGHGTFEPGSIKATYGTGSSLMTLTPALVADTPQLARTVAWSIDGNTQYALEGNIFMTGSAVQWTGEFLGLADPTAGATALAATVEDADGVYLVPAMVGLGAPHWRADARGMLCGLERGHTAAHMARAAVESIAYQVADVFFAMREAAGTPLTELRADGGATRNNSLMQLQAGILGVPVLRSGDEELSALGAAYLGGLALGWWPSLEAIAALPRDAETFAPSLAGAERQTLYQGWQDAVRKACGQFAGAA